MTDTGGTILIVNDEAATIELRSDYLGGKRLAEADGLEAFQRIREVNVQVGLLVMDEHEDAGRAKEALAAMQRGVGGERAESFARSSRCAT